MVIHDIQYYPYRLPFVKPFSTAHGTLTVREGAILVLTTTQGMMGLGEIAPFPGLSKETLAEALDAFHEVVPGLCSKTLEMALTMLDEEREVLPPSTMCGIEMALLDAMEPLSIERSQVQVNAVIGASAIQDAIEAAVQLCAHGFSCVKLKVGVCVNAQQEIARIAAVRDALGPEIALRLDANEAWTYEQARDVLSQCVPYDIEYVEQPVRDVEDMRRLRKTVPIALAADEAVRDIESAWRVISHEAADVLILKPQLTGGLRACQRIVEEAARQRISCVLTTTIESGISLVATLRLAAMLPGITLACGLGTLPLLADDLIREQLVVKDGMMAVPDGAGWGVTLDEDALQRYRV